MFPAASNPYDSLGEAYLKDGQKEAALASYKKSVELNPKNESGLRAIKQLESKEVKIDPAILDAYVGDYEIAPGFVLSVTREGDKLMGQATGQGKAQLEPVSETEFSVPFAGANVTFEKDAAGKVTGLVLNQSGRTIKAKKIK
jgi:hypothetical protein